MTNPRYKEKKFGPYKDEEAIEEDGTKKYAEAIGDLNPLYTDEEYAKKSRYGSIIAPPMYAVTYTLSSIMNCFTDSGMPEVVADFDFEISFENLVHGEQEFEFFKPIKAGDEISTEVRILNVYKKGNLNFVDFGTTSKNQRGELVTKGIMTTIFRS